MYLETTRLRLRPYIMDDLDALHRLWTDPGVRRYLFDDEVVARAFVANEIEQTRALFETSGYGQFAVIPRDQDELIGFCGYRFFHDPPERQLLYGIAPDYWGRGLASEAAHALIRYGFEECGFDEVIASADVPNTASLRVMEKAGMRFQKRTIIDGLDTIYYAITRHDFVAGEAFYRLERTG